MSMLFSPLTWRGMALRNRIMMSPMCMYSAGTDGRATDWHLAHYAARAVGGAGLVVTEATAVEARGRISPNDLGLWEDAQVEPLARLVRLCQAQGARVGVQLAHAGRKAWSATQGVGPAVPVAPSALPQGEGWVMPHALTTDEIEANIAAWVAAAQRAEAAGVDTLEIHSAHGYLLHEFLSPLANQRQDEYGGTAERRAWLLLRVVDAVRGVWPSAKPMLVRLSCSDWHPAGLTIADIVPVARLLRQHGVDALDCSSAGLTLAPPASIGPGYQVAYAEQLRREVGLPTIALGLITAPAQAEHILVTGQADMIALGRVLLREPYWPLHAARALGTDVVWPQAYQRAKL